MGDSDQKSFAEWLTEQRLRNDWIRQIRAGAGLDADAHVDEFAGYGDDLEGLRFRLWLRCWEAVNEPERLSGFVREGKRQGFPVTGVGRMHYHRDFTQGRGPLRNHRLDHLILDLYTLLAHWCRTGEPRTLSDAHAPGVTAGDLRPRLKEYPRIAATIAALVTASAIDSMDAQRVRQYLKDLRRRHPELVKDPSVQSGGTHYR